MKLTPETLHQEIAKEQSRAEGLAQAVQQSLGRIDAYKRLLQHLAAPGEDDEAKRLAQLDDLIKTQTSPGNFDYDPQMLGMANGLLLAASIIKGESPAFMSPPKVWGKDKPDTTAPTVADYAQENVDASDDFDAVNGDDDDQVAAAANNVVNLAGGGNE